MQRFLCAVVLFVVSGLPVTGVACGLWCTDAREGGSHHGVTCTASDAPATDATAAVQAVHDCGAHRPEIGQAATLVEKLGGVTQAHDTAAGRAGAPVAPMIACSFVYVLPPGSTANTPAPLVLRI